MDGSQRQAKSQDVGPGTMYVNSQHFISLFVVTNPSTPHTRSIQHTTSQAQQATTYVEDEEEGQQQSTHPAAAIATTSICSPCVPPPSLSPPFFAQDHTSSLTRQISVVGCGQPIPQFLRRWLPEVRSCAPHRRF
jgi:hypothetical protein